VKFGAVIAAAGLSSRMGSFKPLLPLGNSSFIERIISALREGGAEEIAVVTGRDSPLLEKALAAYRIHFIHNKDYALTGMFYSASLGLQFMAELVEGIFFTPADTPLFGSGVVRLLAAGLQEGGNIILPAYRGKTGHPAAIRSCAVKELTGVENPGGLKAAVDAYTGPKSILETADPGVLYDADTPEEYEFLKTYSATAQVAEPFGGPVPLFPQRYQLLRARR
jgi:CTP:molybdopterin cytidylyltransferase MocA